MMSHPILTSEHMNTQSCPGSAGRATALALTLSLVAACGGKQAPVPTQPVEAIVVVSPAAVHSASGFEFPPEVAGFRWEETNVYDALGLDTSQQYTDMDGVLITFYVYPVEGRWVGEEDSLAREYVEVIDAMAMAHTDYEVLDERLYELVHEDQYSIGYHILARGNRQWGPDLVYVQTAGFLFQHGPWFVKLRASYPTDLGSQGLYSVERFLEELAWPRLAEPGV